VIVGRSGKAYLSMGVQETKSKVKLVEIIRDPRAAKLISDPMRRAILNLLRRKALTEAELAENLGLTDATVNYHLRLLMDIGFLTIVRREPEEHGIMQKFYAPTAYLYLPDVASLPKEVARYYYPINMERARGVLSAMGGSALKKGAKGKEVDEMGEELASTLVDVARSYSGTQIKQGEGEALVNEIYTEALVRLFGRLK
jgi:DNA-binding transcriptional ArsR family regulator